MEKLFELFGLSIRRPTVEGILSSFNKTLNRLNELDAACDRDIARIEEQQHALRDELTDAVCEQERARAAASKLRELIG